MSFDYEIHSGLNLIEIHPAGVVELSDILSYAKEVLARGIVQDGTVEYYDLSDMTHLNLDYMAALELMGTLADWVAQGWYGSVFFAPREHQFGLIRMIGAVATSLEGAPEMMMLPVREPIALGEVRAFITDRRRSG